MPAVEAGGLTILLVCSRLLRGSMLLLIIFMADHSFDEHWGISILGSKSVGSGPMMDIFHSEMG